MGLIPCRRRLSQVLLSVVVCLAICCLPVLTFGGEVKDRAFSRKARIDSLRAHGEYAKAVGVSMDLLELRRADKSAKAYEIEDAKRLVKMLEFAARLPLEAQAELAEADRLDEWLSSYYGRGGYDYENAIAVVERQLAIRRKVLGDEHPAVVASLGNLAILLDQKGDYAGAEPLYRESLAMCRRLSGDEHPAVATILNNLANLLRKRGDYAGAEPLYRESLAMRRRLLGDENRDVAESLNNLATLLHNKGDYGGAEPLYRESLAMYRKLLGDENRDVAGSLSNLAVLLEDKGDYAGAEPLCREALAMRRRLLGGEHLDVAASLDNLAILLADKGDYAGGEPLCREALAMRRRLLGAEHPDVAASLYSLGNLLADKGDYVGAEPLYREALAIYRKVFGAEHPDVATILNSLANLLADKGDYAGAEPLYREALAMRRGLLGAEHPDVAASLNNLALLLADKGDYVGAEPLYRESLAIYRKVFGAEHPDVAASLSNLAVLLADKGDYVGAEPLCRESLAIYRKVFGAEHPYVAGCLNNLAIALAAKEDYTGAESLFANAGGIYDASRLRVRAGVERATFQASPYPFLAAVCLELGNNAGAWRAAERELGRVLADLLVGAGQRSLSPGEAGREDSLKSALSYLEREVEVYQEAGRSDTTGESARRFERARSRLFDVEAEWSVLQRELAEKYPVTEGQVFSLERVQRSIPEQAAIIGWLDVVIRKGESASWGYVIRRDGPVVWARLKVSSGDSSVSAFERLHLFRARLASADGAVLGVRREARALWLERMAPFSEALKDIKSLIVIPSGAMLGVPAEVLVDNEGVPVGDRFVVSYIPSATIYTWLHEQGKERKQAVVARTLLVGDPPFNQAQFASMQEEERTNTLALSSSEPMTDVSKLKSVLAGNREALADLPRLPGTREEVERVSSIAPYPTLFLGPDASEQKIVGLAESGRLRDFTVIHIATHALVDDEEPERSALVLSQVGLPDALKAAMAGTRIYDGLVSAKEIVREWKLDADLVTLSACQTGLGQRVGGEGYVGFSHACLQAGARSLLVSLWKVDDRATSLLMVRFYENYFGKYTDRRNGKVAKKMSKAEALQEAKRWLREYADAKGRKPYEHPYYWSGFVLIGGRGVEEDRR